MSTRLLFLIHLLFSLANCSRYRSRVTGEIIPVRIEQSATSDGNERKWGARHADDRDLDTIAYNFLGSDGTVWFKLTLDQVYSVSKVVTYEYDYSPKSTFSCTHLGCTCRGWICHQRKLILSTVKYGAMLQYLPSYVNSFYGDTVTLQGIGVGGFMVRDMAVVGRKVPQDDFFQALQTRVSALKVAQNSLKEEKEKAAEKISGLVSQLEEQKQKLVDETEKNTGLEADLDKEKGRLLKATNEITGLKSDLDKEKGKLSEANNEIDGLKSDLDQERRKLSDATKEITGLKGDLEEAKKEACSGICTQPEYTLKVMCDDKTTVYVDGTAKTDVIGARKSNQLATIKIPSTTKDVTIKCYNPKVTTANGIKAQIFDSDGNLLSKTGKDWECSKAASSGYEAATITDHHTEWKSILDSGDVIWTSSPKDATAYCKKILS